MKRYEYVTCPLFLRSHQDTYIMDVILNGTYVDINNMGRDGWKLSAIIEDDQDPGTQLGVFIRRVVDATTGQLAEVDSAEVTA